MSRLRLFSLRYLLLVMLGFGAGWLLTAGAYRPLFLGLSTLLMDAYTVRYESLVEAPGQARAYFVVHDSMLVLQNLVAQHSALISAEPSGFDDVAIVKLTVPSTAAIALLEAKPQVHWVMSSLPFWCH